MLSVPQTLPQCRTRSYPELSIVSPKSTVTTVCSSHYLSLPIKRQLCGNPWPLTELLRRIKGTLTFREAAELVFTSNRDAITNWNWMLIPRIQNLYLWLPVLMTLFLDPQFSGTRKLMQAPGASFPNSYRRQSLSASRSVGVPRCLPHWDTLDKR